MLVPGGMLQQGRYQVVRTLGTGGMGAVYLARDLRLGARLVAVKEMVPDPMASPAELAQAEGLFQFEANLLATLDSHPNLPKVSDCFREAGHYYLVMDFVNGSTLEDVLVRSAGPLSETQVLDWAIQLCDVLSYLHGQQPPVIFRDLKPANIMLDQNGRIKLIDFGIARLFDPSKHTDTLRIGTLGYAPPEQYAGHGQTDGRADIFSLGATMHYLLTGRDPSQYAPFSFPPPESLVPAITPATSAAVMKALAYDRMARFQTAAEMKLALEKCRSHSAPGTIGKWQRAAAFMGVVVVVLVIGTVFVQARRGAQPTWTPPTVTVAAQAAVPPAGTVAATVSMPANQVVAPSPTETAASTDMPTATASPITAPPTTAPSATSVPTLTPVPSDTPTPAPSPTPRCGVPAASQLASRWDRASVGCAAAQARVIWGAWQRFEHGALYWRSDTQRVSAFYDDGTWTEFPDQWQEGVPVPSRGSPPAGRLAPVRGFGYVWGSHDELVNRLGWAMEDEKGFCATLQLFERGFIFRSKNTGTCFNDLYNWATNPAFGQLFVKAQADGGWQGDTR